MFFRLIIVTISSKPNIIKYNIISNIGKIITPTPKIKITLTKGVNKKFINMFKSPILLFILTIIGNEIRNGIINTKIFFSLLLILLIIFKANIILIDNWKLVINSVFGLIIRSNIPIKEFILRLLNPSLYRLFNLLNNNDKYALNEDNVKFNKYS